MYRKNQFGRSMIEMLGVLAIIGVLSAGGIAGYTSAMESYKVNRFMEMAAFTASRAESVLPAVKDIGASYNFDVLCSLKIASPDICDNKVADWGTAVRKGYFGEKLNLYVNDNISSTSGSFKDIYGNTGKYYAPYRLVGVRIMSEISEKTCIKIVTNAKWLEIGLLNATSATNALGSLRGEVELPLTIAAAIDACKAEIAAGVDFRINMFVSVKNLE